MRKKVKIFLFFHFYSDFVFVEEQGWNPGKMEQFLEGLRTHLQIYWAKAAFMSHVLNKLYFILF